MVSFYQKFQFLRETKVEEEDTKDGYMVESGYKNILAYDLIAEFIFSCPVIPVIRGN